MNDRSRLAAVILAAAALGTLATAAHPHEFWLAPSTYRAQTGERVEVAAFVGTGFRGERKPYAASRAMGLVLRDARERELRRLARNGDLAMARFTVADEGGALVAYRSTFAVIALPAEEFDEYLKLEGLDAPRAARARRGARSGPGRERYARCSKTWIAGTDTARATRAVGLPLEIVPLADPATASTLPIAVQFRGRPLRNALVRAWRQPLGPAARPRDAAARDSVGPAFEARTDSQGLVTLREIGPGEWLVSAVHMVPCAERSVADWESWWASLTFGRPGGR